MLTDMPVLFDTLTLCHKDGQSPHLKWLRLIANPMEDLLHHGDEAISVATAVSECASRVRACVCACVRACVCVEKLQIPSISRD